MLPWDMGRRRRAVGIGMRAHTHTQNLKNDTETQNGRERTPNHRDPKAKRNLLAFTANCSAHQAPRTRPKILCLCRRLQGGGIIEIWLLSCCLLCVSWLLLLRRFLLFWLILLPFFLKGTLREVFLVVHGGSRHIC